MDPGFAEMDEPEDTVARQEAWDRYTERLFSEESPFLARLSALGVKLEELRPTFEALSENEDVEPALDEEEAAARTSRPRDEKSPDTSSSRRGNCPSLPRPAAGTTTRKPCGGRCGLSAFVDEREPASFLRVVEVLERAGDDAKDAGRLRGQFEALVRDVLTPAIARLARVPPSDPDGDRGARRARVCRLAPSQWSPELPGSAAPRARPAAPQPAPSAAPSSRGSFRSSWTSSRTPTRSRPRSSST